MPVTDVPVINGLTDKEHPCQVLADLLTVMEAFKLKNTAGLKKLHIAYVGDGNNMAQSWMLGAALLGLRLTVASPHGYEPEKDFQIQAFRLSKQSGARVAVVQDPREAVTGAHVVYTDVWTSMGQEEEAEKRREIFRPYQVNESLMTLAHPKAVVLHCLPAHRDEEITAGVLEGPQSVVFQQAENRLHVQKAVLQKFLGRAVGEIVIRSLGRVRPEVASSAFVYPLRGSDRRCAFGPGIIDLARRGPSWGH